MGFEGRNSRKLPFVPSEVEGCPQERVSTTLDTNGEREARDLLAMEPHERAAAGLFLGFQYPVEIPGVSYLQFLRESLNSQRRARGQADLSGAEFIKLARMIKLDAVFVNISFVGSEPLAEELRRDGEGVAHDWSRSGKTTATRSRVSVS